MTGTAAVATLTEGRAAVTPSTDERELLAFIASRTGMMVKRPAIGAEGFVLNHYDRDALARYLDAVGRPMLDAFPAGSPPSAIFCDSLEVYGGDWTPRLLEEFERRRGYDLRPYLPALAGDAIPDADAIRHDWGQTLTELVGDEFLTPLRAWAAARGTKLRAQVYGIPPASVSSNAGVDLPEGEGAQWRELRATRWAASASHVAGTPITSSETWTWLHSPSFMASPLDVKAEADRHFLQGVNQLIGHGWPYSAPGVDYPGWRFYAAGVFSDRNPWWIVMPDLARSLQRLSFLMRQGTPVVEVALLLPVHDAWAGFAPGNVHLIEALKSRVGPAVIPAILDAGFSLDFVDPMTLAHDTAVEGRQLRVGGATLFRGGAAQHRASLARDDAAARGLRTRRRHGSRGRHQAIAGARALQLRQPIARLSQPYRAACSTAAPASSPTPHESVRRSGPPSTARVSRLLHRGPPWAWSTAASRPSICSSWPTRRTSSNASRRVSTPRGIVRNGGIPRQER